MSRLLFVTRWETNGFNDDLEIPWNARWWRHELQPRERDHTMYTTAFSIRNLQGWGHGGPPGKPLFPWAGFIEYYDGRDDWAFPFGIWVLEPHYMDFGSGLVTIRVPTSDWYLDVLDTRPPGWPELDNLFWPWEALTEVGDTRHPSVPATHTRRKITGFHPPR